MVDKKEKLGVDLELQLEELKKAQQLFEEMNNATKQMNQNLLQTKKTFQSITNQQQKIQQNLGTSTGFAAKTNSRGSPTVQFANAEEARVKASVRAFETAEAQKLRATQQRVAKTDSLEQASAKLRAQRERLALASAGQLPRDANGRFTSIQKEISATARLEAQVTRLNTIEKQRNATLKQTESIQRSINNGRARLQNQQLQQVTRDNAVSRVSGDGGASLFKIQAQLLGNYLVMGKIFELFQFGSQFVLQLDQAFTQLQAITGTTATEMQQLRTELISVSEQTKFTAVEVAEAATVLGQAGFSTTEIKESIQDVTLLATAVGTDLKTAVDLTTSVLSIFNLRAEETGHIANVLTGAINNSKLTLDKLTLGLQFAGNTAAQAGATFEETVSVLGAMANAGIRSGSTLGTGLRQVLVSFLNPTAKMKVELEKLGLTMEDIDVKSNGLVNVFETLKDAGFGAANAFGGMQVRAAAAFLAVSNNLDVARDLEEALLLTNAAAAANEVQMTSLSNSLDRFKSILGTVIVNFSEPFKNFLISSIQLFGGLLQAVNNLGIVLPVIGTAMIALGSAALISRFAKLATGVLGLGAASNTLAVGFTRAATSATLATAAMARLKLAVAAIGGPIGLAIAGLIAFVQTVGLLNQSTETLDQLQAELDDAQGKFEKTGQKVDSVDEAIERLTNRYATLTQDSRQLQNEALKLQVQFGEMGLSVDVVGGSVDKLISSLKELRGELLKGQGLELDAVQSGRVNLFEQQLKELDVQNKGGKLNSLLTRDNFNPFDKIASNENLSGAFDKNITTTRDSISELAGINLNEFTSTQIRGQVINELSEVRNDLNDQLNTAAKELSDLRNRQKEGEIVSSATLGFAEDFINSLKSQKAIVDQIQANVAQYVATISEADQISFDQTSTAEEFRQLIQGFATDTSKLKDDLKGVKNPIDRQKIASEYFDNIEDIEKFTTEALVQLVDVVELEKELGKRLSAEDIKQFIKNYQVQFAGKVSERLNATGAVDEAANKYVEDEFEIKLKLLEKEKKLLLAQLANTDNSKERGSLVKRITDLINQLFVLETNKLAKDAFNESDSNKRELINKDIQLAGVEKDTEIIKLNDSVKKFGDKFLNVNEALAKATDELDKISQIADNSTRGIEQQLTRIQAAIGNADENGLTKGQVYRLERRQKALEDEALAVRQTALQQQLEQTQALVDKRRVDVQESRARLGDFAKSDKINEVKQKIQALDEAEKALVDTQRELSETSAELEGNMGKVEEAAGSVADDINAAIDAYARQIDTDPFEVITGSLDAAQSGLATFLTDVTSGTKSIKDAFKDMAVSVIESIQQIVAEWVAAQITKAILGSFGFGLNDGGSVSGGSSIGSLLGFNGGGQIPTVSGLKRANNGYGIPNRDSVPILARPGEYVLRNSAVSLIGKDNLDQINGLGNKRISQGVAGPTMNESGGDNSIVNVYVVSPDQKPSMTPQDVIVTITDDLAKGGPTKKLVKTIQMGKI